MATFHLGILMKKNCNEPRSKFNLSDPFNGSKVAFDVVITRGLCALLLSERLYVFSTFKIYFCQEIGPNPSFL